MYGQDWVGFPLGLKYNLQHSCCSVFQKVFRTPKFGNNTSQNAYNKVQDHPSPFLETNALLFQDSVAPARESSYQRTHGGVKSSLSISTVYMLFPKVFCFHWVSWRNYCLGQGVSGKQKCKCSHLSTVLIFFWSLCGYVPFLSQNNELWYNMQIHILSGNWSQQTIQTAQTWVGAQLDFCSIVVFRLAVVAALSWGHWLDVGS